MYKSQLFGCLTIVAAVSLGAACNSKGADVLSDTNASGSSAPLSTGDSEKYLQDRCGLQHDVIVGEDGQETHRYHAICRVKMSDEIKPLFVPDVAGKYGYCPFELIEYDRNNDQITNRWSTVYSGSVDVDTVTCTLASWDHKLTRDNPNREFIFVLHTPGCHSTDEDRKTACKEGIEALPWNLKLADRGQAEEIAKLSGQNISVKFAEGPGEYGNFLLSEDSNGSKTIGYSVFDALYPNQESNGLGASFGYFELALKDGDGNVWANDANTRESTNYEKYFERYQSKYEFARIYRVLEENALYHASFQLTLQNSPSFQFSNTLVFRHEAKRIFNGKELIVPPATPTASTPVPVMPAAPSTPEPPSATSSMTDCCEQLAAMFNAAPSDLKENMKDNMCHWPKIPSACFKTDRFKESVVLQDKILSILVSPNRKDNVDDRISCTKKPQWDKAYYLRHGTGGFQELCPPL